MKRQLLIDYRGARTQEEMAKLYGVTQQVWSRWETGSQKPKIVTMKRLEDAIGRPMEEIFFDVFYNLKSLTPHGKNRSRRIEQPLTDREERVNE